jgi:predicted RNA-binding Zn ribbon-like protein
MKENQDIFEMRLDGGNLSLNFVNTVYDRHGPPYEGYLHNYLDLITWSHYTGAINTSQKKRLLEISRKNQDQANQIYKSSIQLREAIYEFIVSMIDREDVPPVNMPLINQWLSKAFSNLELTQLENRFVLDWKTENFGLESVLWPIIRSFVDLITSDDRKRIKQCSNCGWVFVDNSKNKSRRWCSMEICGNRVKAQRHAEKTRT